MITVSFCWMCRSTSSAVISRILEDSTSPVTFTAVKLLLSLTVLIDKNDYTYNLRPRRHSFSLISNIDVKNVFLRFFIPLTFLTFFNVFYFVNVFYLKKTFTKNNKFYQEVREALLKPQKQINRPRLYYESGWIQPGEQYVSQCL